MKKALIVLAILAAGCTERDMQRMQRNTQYTNRNYEITVYSGNGAVYHDTFNGIINQEEGTDGIYYFRGDTMIEISGNYVIKSTK